MKRYFLAICVAALMLMLTATALAFSFSLQTLHLSAASFSSALVAPSAAAPMTYGDESEIAPAAAPGSQVRMEQVQAPAHLCQRDHIDAQTEEGF